MKTPDEMTRAECLARQSEIQAGFAATKGDAKAKEERALLNVENEALIQRLRELKQGKQVKRSKKAEKRRRNTLGIGSLFYEVVKASVDAATLAAFEIDARARLAAREAKTTTEAAERTEREASAITEPIESASSSEPSPTPPPASAARPKLPLSSSSPPPGPSAEQTGIFHSTPLRGHRAIKHQPEIIRLPSRGSQVRSEFAELQRRNLR
jgi:hypothetical protein